MPGICSRFNTVTACLVVQAVRDNGKPRPGIPHSGPGHCDSDDEILAERWQSASPRAGAASCRLFRP